MISRSANIGYNNYFSEDVIVEDGVIIGNNNSFQPHCFIKSGTLVGDNNTFGAGIIIGTPSRERVMGTQKEKIITPVPSVVIGNNNYFEAYTVIQSSLEGKTVIQNHVCTGAFSHISHDTILCDEVVLSSHCSIAGYCIVSYSANIGMGVQIHQRSVVGAFAMVGAGSVVVNHIAPAATVVGIPAKYLHVNSIGLERHGYTTAETEEAARWLEGGCSKKNVPTFLREYFNQFNESLLLWHRDRAVIPEG